MAPPNPVLAGLACRCPHCGEGSLFKGFLKVAPRCAVCGFDLSRADSGDGPAVFIILIAGFLCAFGALYTDLAFKPPVWLELMIWLPLALLVSVGLLRPVKGVMLALQFHHNAAEARHGE